MLLSVVLCSVEGGVVGGLDPYPCSLFLGPAPLP